MGGGTTTFCPLTFWTHLALLDKFKALLCFFLEVFLHLQKIILRFEYVFLRKLWQKTRTRILIPRIYKLLPLFSNHWMCVAMLWKPPRALCKL